MDARPDRLFRPRSGPLPGLGRQGDFRRGRPRRNFQAHIGKNTPLRLNRGPNRLWSRGGLLHAPPIPINFRLGFCAAQG